MKIDKIIPSQLFSKWVLTVQILNCISSNKDNTIPRIMKKTGSSYTAIKNIVEELVTHGIIAEKKLPESKDRGRPPKTYTLLKHFEIAYPPRKYDLLLSYLLSTLKSKTDLNLPQLLSDIGVHRAVEKISELKKHNIKINSISDLAEIINKDLENENIPHDVTVHDNAIEIKIYSCIFKKISTEFSPLICLVHENYYSKLLEYIINVEYIIVPASNLSKNDSECSFILTSSKPLI